MIAIKKHLGFIGCKVQDKVTGFKGVVTSISFDLYGCIQAVVTPPTNKEGAAQDGRWFDINRLILQSEKPVMEIPNFNYGEVAEGKKARLKSQRLKIIN